MSKRALMQWIPAVLALAIAPATFAVTVEITITGTVEFNQISAPPLGDVTPGEPVTLTLTVDSDVFENSAAFPTRGYVIEPGSFSLAFASAAVGLQDPFPPGETPFFVLRNDDPAVDGFVIATSLDFPNGVPVNQEGILEQFRCNYYVTYQGSTLGSLDILDALGSYDFGGLTVFNFTVDDGPFQPLGIIFEQMTLTLTAPATEFIRGDGNGDGAFSGLTDGLYLLDYQFSGGPPPPCFEAADADGDGAINGLIDGLWILNHQFTGGPPPPAPYPDCGADPFPPGSLGCDAGCP